MKDKLRMSQWFILSLALYAAAFGLRAALGPLSPIAPVETALWKLGNVSIAAYVGYFIDRTCFPCHRIVSASEPLAQCRRALLVGTAMLAVSMGL